MRLQRIQWTTIHNRIRYVILCCVVSVTLGSCKQPNESYNKYKKALYSFYKNSSVVNDTIRLYNEADIECIIVKTPPNIEIKFKLNGNDYGHYFYFVNNRLKMYRYLTQPGAASYQIHYHPKQGIRGIYGTPLVDIWENPDETKTVVFSTVEYDSLAIYNSITGTRMNSTQSNYFPFMQQSIIPVSNDYVPLTINCYSSGNLVRMSQDTLPY